MRAFPPIKKRRRPSGTDLSDEQSCESHVIMRFIWVQRIDYKKAFFEREFFAVFVAFWLWGSMITDAADNNGVRDTLISCSTRNQTARLMLTAVLALEST